MEDIYSSTHRKNKNTTRPEELRPINTLPSDEKILESIVKQLLEYLTQHDIIINQ